MAGSILCAAGGARASARTSTGDGPWCAPATWQPPGPPQAADKVTIAAGHHVVLDGSCSQVAADITIGASASPPAYGVLSTLGGQTLTVGDPVSSYAILNAGLIEFTGGDRLEIDCDAVNTTNCEVANVAGGRFVAHGVQLGGGVVDSVSGENCPANSDFLPDAPFHATDCTDISLEVDGLGAVEDDDPRFVGRYIRFAWPSAHRGTWYKIVGASAPNRLILDYNSEGQQAARGIGPATATATATVAQGLVAVLWPGGLSGADARASLGAWFLCDDDCPAVTNDSPFASASSERLPCASARRIVDVPVVCEGGSNPGASCPNGTECLGGGTCSGVTEWLQLESGYPTHACEGAAPARIIGSSAGSGHAAVDYVERFVAGDPFVVWDPVTLSVPDANKQFASTQDKTAAGLRFANDAVVDLEGVRMSFWGRGDTAIGGSVYDPIQSQLSSANTSGALYMRQVEIAHFGGNEAVNYRNIKNGLGRNEDVTARDPLPTDQGVDPAKGHGLWINQYDYAGGDGIAAIVRWRGTRLGDDCIVVSGDSTSAPNTYDFARITLDHPTCTFASTLGQQPSAQCFDLEDTDLQVRDGVDILAPLCSNYHNGGLAWVTDHAGASTSGRWLVSDGVFQNVQWPCMGAFPHADYSAFRVLLVNSLCRGLPLATSQPEVGATGVIGADVFSSYIADADRGIVDADMVKGAFVTLGYGNNDATGLYTGSIGPGNFTSSDQTYEDVAVVRQSCPPGLICPWSRGFDLATNDVLTSDLTLSHGTFAGLSANSAGVAWQTSDNATALATVRDSVVWDIRYLFSVQGTAGNLTESNNLYIRTPNFCVSGGASCPPRSPTTLSTGVLAFGSLATGDLTPLPGTTPFTMATSDATPAGARVAGPASWARLERVLPALKDLGRPGVHIPAYAIDTDNDGLFDLHDECPTVPLQSLLSPGTPGSCEAVAPGCDLSLDGVPTSCGLGECASTGVCTNGSDTCLAGAASPEICDGLDNDCNGTIDDEDTDADGVSGCFDNCPSVANPEQSDSDGDGVGDVCDNCLAISNPRVYPDIAATQAAYLAANPWATLTGGQRDDDHDGFGNKCDADFTAAGVTVGPSDLAEFRSASGKNRALDICGTLETRPCAIFDLDEGSNVIGPSDLTRFREQSGKLAGPKCPTCPLTCSAGDEGSCD